MKKILPITAGLLAASLILLIGLLIARGLSTRRQQAQIQNTQTALAAEQTARQATEAARPSATPSPSPTVSPSLTFTPSPPTSTPETTPTESEPELVEGCDVAAYLADVTVPDGTQFDPGKKFTKTWRLLNAGDCTWNSFYKLYFVSGDKMSGPTSQQLTPLEVPPGASIDISVELKAPREPGKYTGYWGFKNTNGAEFGIGPQNNPIYVEIKVVD